MNAAIIAVLSSEWSRYHRPGLLRAVAAAADGPVLVVDNPVCLSTARWHRPQRWLAWKEQQAKAAQRKQQGLSAVGAHLTQLDERLYLLDTALPLHDRLASRCPPLAALNRAVLARQVRAALQHLGCVQTLATWWQFPTQHPYPGLLDEALAFYECFDEHSEVPGLSSTARQRLARQEQLLLACCPLVFTTSRPLYEAKRLLHPDVVLSYNAADLPFYAPVAQDSLRRAHDRTQQGGAPGSRSLAAAATLTLGYLGTLHEHTDLALLADMAELRPDWRFVIAGPVQRGAAQQALLRLQRAANVELQGWVEAADLNALLCRIDVGLIPYLSSARFNHFVNPNKLHEYTAMGKPVVASPGLDLSSHPGAVTVANGAAAFIAAAQEAHARNDLVAVQRRLALAQQHAWPARAAQMLQAIHRCARVTQRMHSNGDISTHGTHDKQAAQGPMASALDARRNPDALNPCALNLEP